MSESRSGAVRASVHAVERDWYCAGAWASGCRTGDCRGTAIPGGGAPDQSARTLRRHVRTANLPGVWSADGGLGMRPVDRQTLDGDSSRRVVRAREDGRFVHLRDLRRGLDRAGSTGSYHVGQAVLDGLGLTSELDRNCRVAASSAHCRVARVRVDERSCHASWRPPSDSRPRPLRGAEMRSGQETDGGQRCLRHSSHVANPAGGSSMGSLPSSSPGVGMSMLAAHPASSSWDMGQVVCDASAWR